MSGIAFPVCGPVWCVQGLWLTDRNTRNAILDIDHRHSSRQFESCVGSTADTYKKITLSMFNNGPGGYPMMRGKAGCIRTFNKVLHTVWLEGLNPSDDMHVRVALLLETSICIDEIVSSHTRVFKLPAAVADTLFAKTCLYCQLATSLSNYAGVKLFIVTQKFHLLVHIGWSARYINPRIS